MNEAREKLQEFLSSNVGRYDCQGSCPDEVAIYELEHDGETIRTDEYCNKCFANQILNLLK